LDDFRKKGLDGPIVGDPCNLNDPSGGDRFGYIGVCPRCEPFCEELFNEWWEKLFRLLFSLLLTLSKCCEKMFFPSDKGGGKLSTTLFFKAPVTGVFPLDLL
jgi:hypothetical protein